MVFMDPDKRRPGIFQPLRKALLGTTPFNPSAPVNRFQLSLRERRLPLMLNGQALDARVSAAPVEPLPVTAVPSVAADVIVPVTPSGPAVQETAPAPALAPKQPEKITPRINPLAAARKGQQLNLVKRELIQERPGAKAQPVKVVPAIGMIERECDRRFISDDGSYVDTSQKILKGLDQRRLPAERRKNRQQPGETLIVEAEEPIDQRAKDYKKGLSRVPIGSGVGVIFDLNVWAVDFTDAPRFPSRGECRNPNFSCRSPAVESKSYCAECAAAFSVQPGADTYASRLVRQAEKSRARQEETDRRIERLKNIYARYEARLSAAAGDEDVNEDAEPLLLAAE